MGFKETLTQRLKNTTIISPTKKGVIIDLERERLAIMANTPKPETKDQNSLAYILFSLFAPSKKLIKAAQAAADKVRADVANGTLAEPSELIKENATISFTNVVGILFKQQNVFNQTIVGCDQSKLRELAKGFNDVNSEAYKANEQIKNPELGGGMRPRPESKRFGI